MGAHARALIRSRSAAAECPRPRVLTERRGGGSGRPTPFPSNPHAAANRGEEFADYLEMPKSKRNKVVTLSKTKRKGREHKEQIVDGIRQALEDHSSAYVFSFENMRNSKFKEFREQLKPTSRFFLGSNKVMQVAVGRSSADEARPGIHKLAKFLRGDAGLFFTKMSKEEVERLFNKYEENDFARTGSIATEKVELKEGPLDQFTHEMEPFLRQQGLPVRLNKGVIELVSDFVVCEEGAHISPEASRTLRLLGIKMATFRLHLLCRWGPSDFEVYADGPGHSDFS